MIIYGWRGRTYTKKKGQFNCPQCGGPREHKHRRVRQFFDVYFIPIIPMQLVAEYVECQTCRCTFDLNVLNYDPQREEMEFHAEYVGAILRTMVMIMIADGEIDQGEVRVVKQVFQDLTGKALSNDDLKVEIDATRRDQGDLISYLKASGGMLNDQGKGQVVTAAYRVAAADGHIDESEMQVIYEIGDALELSDAHLQGIINQVA